MKTWWTTLLAILVFASSFQSSLVLVDYHINQDFYENHCENKDRPELSCHGKCQLNQEQDQSGIYLVAKFCFEMNVLPTSEIKITEDNGIENPLVKINFNRYSSRLSHGYFHKIPKPPQI